MSQHRDNEVGLGIALLLLSAYCDLSSLSLGVVGTTLSPAGGN